MANAVERSGSEVAPAEIGPALFIARAVNTSGSTGESWVTGGLRVDVASPLEAHGSAATNPEELIALAWATCLNASARVIAGAGIDVCVEASIQLHRRLDGDGYEFSARAELFFAGQPASEATRLAQAAHTRCPVSRMLRGSGHVEVTAGTESE